MKFYFSQITSGHYILLWQMGSDNISAKSNLFLTQGPSVTTEKITTFDLTKLSHSDGIIIQDGAYFIPNLEAFLQTHPFNKVEFVRVSNKTSEVKREDLIVRRSSPTQTFALHKIMGDSSDCASSLTSTALTSKGELHVVANYNDSIITTEQELLYLKKKEHTNKLQQFKVERIKIINAMIDTFFEGLLVLKIEDSVYKFLCDYLIKAVKEACLNRDLDLPLDHEIGYQDKSTNNLHKYDIIRIQRSKDLEVDRANVLACFFDYETLPAELTGHIEQLKLKEAYLVKFKCLVDNIIETGRCIRSLNLTLTEYKQKLQDRKVCEYVCLDVVLRDAFQTFLVNPLMTSDSRVSTEKKTNYSWEKCQGMLIEKIANAILTVDKEKKEQNLKPLINPACLTREEFGANPKIFVKATHKAGLVELLKNRFSPGTTKDYYHVLGKKIEESANDPKFLKIFNQWFNQTTVSQNPSP